MSDNSRKIGLMELDEAYHKTLIWFFSFPDAEIGLTGLAREIGMAKTTANKIITRLIKEGFLTRKIYGKTWSLSCDKAHPFNFFRKIPHNISTVMEAYSLGLREDILRVVPNPVAVILFGSYWKGDDNEKSDIDIAVEVVEGKQKTVEVARFQKLGYRKNVAVNLLVFTRKGIDPNLFGNIANGIVIEGFLEVRP